MVVVGVGGKSEGRGMRGDRWGEMGEELGVTGEG